MTQWKIKEMFKFTNWSKNKKINNNNCSIKNENLNFDFDLVSIWEN